MSIDYHCQEKFYHVIRILNYTFWRKLKTHFKHLYGFLISWYVKWLSVSRKVLPCTICAQLFFLEKTKVTSQTFGFLCFMNWTNMSILSPFLGEGWITSWIADMCSFKFPSWQTFGSLHELLICVFSSSLFD